MRKVANVPVIQSLRRVLNGANVAKNIKHRESITVLQGAQRTVDQRGLRLDLVLGPDVEVTGTLVWVWFELALGVRHVPSSDSVLPPISEPSVSDHCYRRVMRRSAHGA